MFDINPIKHAHNDCLQASLITLAKYWNRDYIFMFADSWGFKYRNNNPELSFGERIDSDHYQYINQLLRDYHGIDCYWNLGLGLDELYTLIKKELYKEFPCIIVVDSFWCPWLKDYQKINTEHFCIVLGIEEDTGNLICLDPYYSMKKEILPYKDLANGYIKLMTFELLKAKELKDIDYKFVLSKYALKCLHNRNDYTAFEHMSHFADDLGRCFDFKKEMDGYDDVESVPLFFKLKLLESGRNNLSTLLYFLSDSHNVEDLKVHSKNVKDLSNLWNKLRLYLMKLSFAKPTANINEKISRKIYEIVDLEKKVAIEIEQWLGK